MLEFPIHGYSQVSFFTVSGVKAKYRIDIPKGYSSAKKIGKNVDLKYENQDGAAIVTVVRVLESDIGDRLIDLINQQSNEQLKNQIEATGLLDITILKKGIISINNRKSFFTYYKDEDFYFHSISQINGKILINITYTCPLSKRHLYMPYVNRVMNSLLWYN
jgi:hypothetical protein